MHRPSIRHLSIVVIVVVLVGVVWWLSGERRPDPQDTPTATSTRHTTETGPDPVSTLIERDTTTRTELAPPTDAAQLTPDPNTTVILGRCVDTDGTPLAGVTARLHGRSGGQQRLDAYLRDHPPIEWRDPDPITTGDDGRFTFSLTPPPPFQFSIGIIPRGRVSMQVGWSELPPAKVIDLGDLVFDRGVTVSGRIFDTNGLPRENVVVVFNRIDDHGLAGMSKYRSARVNSAADGTFTFPQSFAPGTWNLLIHGARMITPESRRVEIKPPAHVLDVVVEAAVPMATFEGIVVDETGAPVPGATVEGVVDGQAHPDLKAMSGDDGKFTISLKASDVRPVKWALHVHSDAHEPLKTEAVHTFGDPDVRLVLTDGLPLEIIVRHDADGTPVEEFSLRLMPKPGTHPRITSNDHRVRGANRHENGIVRLTGIRRGLHLLVIDPAVSTGLFGAYFIETNVEDGAPSVVHVRLQPVITQRVVVEHSDGSPVPGTLVELLLATPGRQFKVDSWTQKLEDWHGADAVRLAECLTATDGSCEFRGARAPSFSIRVRGNGHMTTVVTGVRLGVVDPLRIVVPIGARLIGRLAPAEAALDLREIAGLPPNGPLTEPQSRRAPHVQLKRQPEGMQERVPGVDADRVLITEDGTFVIDGIPPGTWSLDMMTCRYISGSHTYSTSTLHTGITFADSETKELTFDLTSRRFGRLRAVVMLDGMPYQGDVVMQRVDEPEHFGVTCDAHGRLDVLVPPGRWTASPCPRLKPRGTALITPLEVATVTPGQSVEITFRAQSAYAKVRVLSADGTPAARMVMMVHDSRGNHLHNARTEADGTFEIWLAPGNYQVRARREEGEQVTIGDVTLPDAAEVVLRLPK